MRKETTVSAFSMLLILTGCVMTPGEDPVTFEERDTQNGAICEVSGPCEDHVLCDETGASEDGRCENNPSGECRSFMVPEGVDCFPTANVKVGHCNGKGVCGQ